MIVPGTLRIMYGQYYLTEPSKLFIVAMTNNRFIIFPKKLINDTFQKVVVVGHANFLSFGNKPIKETIILFICLQKHFQPASPIDVRRLPRKEPQKRKTLAWSLFWRGKQWTVAFREAVFLGVILHDMSHLVYVRLCPRFMRVVPRDADMIEPIVNHKRYIRIIFKRCLRTAHQNCRRVRNT